MTINRQWRLAKRPVGMVGRDNFEFVETTVPKVQDQQILIKNLYFLSTPRNAVGWSTAQLSSPVGIGEVMRGGTVGQVVLSNHQDFAEGDLVQTMGGWQDYAVITPGEGVTGVTKIPEGVTPEMMLSVIGLTGITAYFGMLELGQPKAGETILVSGAQAQPARSRLRLPRSKAAELLVSLADPKNADGLPTLRD